MKSDVLLLAQLNWDALWEDKGIPLAVMGLLTVFAALILVRVFIGTLPKIMALLAYFFPESKPETKEQPQAAAAAVPKTPEAKPAAKAAPTPTSEEIPEHIVAVIAAVVADIVSVSHRIVRTRQLSSEEMGWALEGRLQHHASHRLQPRDRS